MKLCLGTAQFQNSYGFKKVFIKDKDQVLNYCLSNGINSFDTSTEYGNALEYLSKYKIEKIDIYLKIKIDTSQNLQTIVDDIQKNLNYCIKNLGEKNIRGLLFHRPQDFIHLDEKSLKLIFSS
jgi:aryl-alcohol dehydrogenase-like predicted oxidoreductase